MTPVSRPVVRYSPSGRPVRADRSASICRETAGQAVSRSAQPSAIGRHQTACRVIHYILLSGIHWF